MRTLLIGGLVLALATSASAQSLGDTARENRSADKPKAKRVYTDENPLPAADEQSKDEVLPWQFPYSRRQVEEALERLLSVVAHYKAHGVSPGSDSTFERLLASPENLLTSAEWRRTIAKFYNLRISECKARVPSLPESAARETLRTKLDQLLESKRDDRHAASRALSRSTKANGLDSPRTEAVNRDVLAEEWTESQMSKDYQMTTQTCDDLRAMARTPRK